MQESNLSYFINIQLYHPTSCLKKQTNKQTKSIHLLFFTELGDFGNFTMRSLELSTHVSLTEHDSVKLVIHNNSIILRSLCNAVLNRYSLQLYCKLAN